jgi:hypothetical protein
MYLASELCQTVGDELFFTLHIFLQVGKPQDLPSKISKIFEMLGLKNKNANGINTFVQGKGARKRSKGTKGWREYAKLLDCQMDLREAKYIHIHMLRSMRYPIHSIH